MVQPQLRRLDYWAFPATQSFGWGAYGLSENDFEGSATWWAPIPIAPFSGSLGTVNAANATTTNCGPWDGPDRETAPRGQALLETAIALPLFLLALFGTIWAVQYSSQAERTQSMVRWGGLIGGASDTVNDYSLLTLYGSSTPSRPQSLQPRLPVNALRKWSSGKASGSRSPPRPGVHAEQSGAELQRRRDPVLARLLAAGARGPGASNISLTNNPAGP